MIEKLYPIIPPWCEALLPPAGTAASNQSSQVKSVRLLGSAYTAEQLRPTQWPEVAVLGRSNAGKSSLVNYLLGSSGLAKVSSQPGAQVVPSTFLAVRNPCEEICKNVF